MNYRSTRGLRYYRRLRRTKHSNDAFISFSTRSHSCDQSEVAMSSHNPGPNLKHSPAIMIQCRLKVQPQLPQRQSMPYNKRNRGRLHATLTKPYTEKTCFCSKSDTEMGTFCCMMSAISRGQWHTVQRKYCSNSKSNFQHFHVHHSKVIFSEKPLSNNFGSQPYLKLLHRTRKTSTSQVHTTEDNPRQLED